jgi:hypothetical protein
VTVFQERRLPEQGTPAGYSALIDAYGLQAPLPRTLSATGAHHRIREEGGWRIMTPRHAPHPTLEGHMTFALKYEGLDLAVLKRLFLAAGPGAIEALVREKSTGGYARRIWFLYEWLTGARLGLPDAASGRYVPVVDPEHQYTAKDENAPRYRVKNNLPGTPAFCPVVSRTPALERFIGLNPRPCTRNRRERAARSAGANSGIPAAEGFPVKLRHRGRATAAGPHPEMGPRHRRGRPSASRRRRTAAPAEDRHRRCAFYQAWHSGGGRFRRRA